ncbi:hypothetical protein COX93_00430 [Candidatus Nomurabacteria bacterium CG_4_10_14_0_2_um_filter_30_12]|uniref:Uncharacterized protein n=3 Tax=Candidatus Nomuraibacteriota TaxID=1752729 RepID=A0A1J4UZG3_9BACT|nr:MAG: hypothetical protein AUJ22_02025 [Candidatus Nomurabacteria bacterium CG1_02_31_12]PIR68858.1 MAG: hypothetical protein COU48_01815 [Candidatus Nomurabacteria bacterium CG10_big_fil_rev_8_21_14_0_10_03_31_7]PIZ87657.1 MAG: hypothetical protein COX93_00430 [Candidatus Nomurabacteria bacterium CG_4_10_14_0_2_um_filter_30_12]
MITEKITSGQKKTLLRVLEDAVDASGLTKDQTTEILKVGNLVQADLKISLIKHSISNKRFELLVDLGIVTVPENYVHGKQLDSLNRKEFYYFNEDIIDANFSNPTRILKPGDKLWVRAFKQVSLGSTTSEDRMEFSAKMNAVYPGIQGAYLVYQQKCDQLPKRYWYCSFDEKERLWKDTDGHRRVPNVHADSSGDFEFYLGYFESDWDGHSIILLFCDMPTEVGLST